MLLASLKIGLGVQDPIRRVITQVDTSCVRCYGIPKRFEHTNLVRFYQHGNNRPTAHYVCVCTFLASPLVCRTHTHTPTPTTHSEGAALLLLSILAEFGALGSLGCVAQDT